MLKRILFSLDEYLPNDIFAMIIKEFESGKPFMEKIKSTLKIEILDLSPVTEELKSDRPLLDKIKAFLP
jgi:hypothetical protein